MRREAERVAWHNTDDGKEKIGDALGAADRRVRSDLGRFKELVEANGASGGWRGEVKRPDEA